MNKTLFPWESKMQWGGEVRVNGEGPPTPSSPMYMQSGSGVDEDKQLGLALPLGNSVLFLLAPLVTEAWGMAV